MFEIEKNVPIPAGAAERRQGRTKYPFATMEVGDSFFVPGEQKMASTVTSAQNRTGFKFAHWSAEKDGVKGTYVQRIAGESPIKQPKRKPRKSDAPAAEGESTAEGNTVESTAPAAELPTLPEPAAVKPGRVAKTG